VLIKIPDLWDMMPCRLALVPTLRRALSRQKIPTTVLILHHPRNQHVFLQNLYTRTNSTYYNILRNM